MEPVYAAQPAEPLRYCDEFYPLGFRKSAAIMLVVFVTVVPEVFSWSTGPAEPVPQSRMPSGRFAPRGGFLPEREEPSWNILGTFLAGVKRVFILVFATLGVMLYYPRPGFKRYALLVGPLIAFLVPMCVGLYLQGRTEVFRAEILVVSLVALAPGVALYVFLTWRKAKRLGMAW